MTAQSHPGMAHQLGEHRRLMGFMLLSLSAGLVTMAMKAAAAIITGSVGFFSDALESGVNVVAALVGMVALRTAARPPDHEHHFGHGKAEYLSAGIEGGMVLTAAVLIVWTAGRRLIDIEPLEQPAIGLVLSAVAAVINLWVGMVLIRAGRTHRSLTLEADGRHLLTDVWTSAGVLVGVGLVAVFKLPVLDPIVALIVGVNVLWAGYQLLRRSVVGLLDAALRPEDFEKVVEVLDSFAQVDRVEFGPVRTRESGRQRFVYLKVRVPPEWTVKRSHDLADRIEAGIAAVLPGAYTFTHIEPLE